MQQRRGRRFPPLGHEDNKRERLVTLAQQLLHVTDRRLHELLTEGGVRLERPAHRLEVQDRPAIVIKSLEKLYDFY